MPIQRPLSSSRARAMTSSEVQRALGHQRAMITILWVCMLFLVLGFSVVLLGFAARMWELNAVEQAVVQMDARLTQTRMDLSNLQQACAPTPVVGAASSTPGLPVSTSAAGTSPSGELTRGSVSPDGTKFAGYENNAPGHNGVAVELLNATTGRKIRYIVIFNPTTQSTGVGHAEQNQMSVSWLNNNTIQYNILQLTNGKWVEQTQTVTVGL